MTIKELANLQVINREIKMLEDRIEEIRTRAEHITPNVSTFVNADGEVCVLPNASGGGGGDKMLNDVCALIKEENALQKAKDKRNKEKEKLWDYINSIEDSQLRQTFFLRFYEGLSWQAVAMRVGGRNTEDSVKKQVYRFVNKY